MSSTNEPMYFAIFDHIAHKQTMTIAERLDEFEAEARLGDELGFDYYFTTEHHFSGDFSLSPSQSVTLAVLARCTERIRFGPMITILPISQPLRVVEEFLILDHLSRGRLEIGLGRGITAHEHLTYGVQYDDSTAMFAEALEFVDKALTTQGRFSWNGRYLQYFDIEIPWKPFQTPRPPIWVPTSSPATAKSMGQRGFGMGGFGLLGAEAYRPVFEAYNAGWAESGLPESTKRVSWMLPIVVAETDERARQLAYEHFAYQISLFEVESRHSQLVAPSAALRSRYEGSQARLREMREDPAKAESRGFFIAGSPDTVIGKIRELQTGLGVNTFIGEFNIGLMEFEDTVRSLELFASEVMPAFQRSSQAIAA